MHASAMRDLYLTSYSHLLVAVDSPTPTQSVQSLLIGQQIQLQITPTTMISTTARAAVLLAIAGIAAANPRRVKCRDYTDEANQKVIKN